MTTKQLKLYRGTWAQVRRKLIERGMRSVDAEKNRHALHVKALGFDKSSLDLTNKDLDKILKEFWAITQDADLRPQIRQDNMAKTRALHTIEILLRVLEKDHAYAQGIIRQMNRENTLGGAELQFEDLTEEQLMEKLLPALKKACRRQWPTKENLIAAVLEWATAAELDGDTANQVAAEALRTPRLPPLDMLNYEQLLTIWAALRRLCGTRVQATQIVA